MFQYGFAQTPRADLAESYRTTAMGHWPDFKIEKSSVTLSVNRSQNFQNAALYQLSFGTLPRPYTLYNCESRAEARNG